MTSSNAIRSIATRHTGALTSLPVSPDPFAMAVREGVRQTRRSCEGLSRKQHRLLDDLTKARYVNGLRLFVEITRAHCTDPRDATALWHRLAALTLSAHVEDYTVGEAYGLETLTNYELDDAQNIHALRASTGTVDALVERASAQEVASAVLKHVVIRQRPALVQSGIGR
jgi:hypothetical protein